MSNISDNDNDLNIEREEEKEIITKKKPKLRKKLSLTKYKFENIKIEKQPTKKAKNYVDLSSQKENKIIKLFKNERSKLLKTFNYLTHYITSSNILHTSKPSLTMTINNPLYNSIDTLDEFKLPPSYCCSCKNICLPEFCECIKNHVQKFECNDKCTCNRDSCSNRCIQFGLTHKFYIRYISKTKGFGLFADEDIDQGEYVCEYIGNIITKNEAEQKIHYNLINQKPNYILQLKEEYPNIIISTYIDSEKYGNLARFINHSCEPNLDFEIIRINSFIPHCAFFANKKIYSGEEITFSYVGFNDSNNNENINDKNNGIEKENNKIENTLLGEKRTSFSYKKCLCGSKNCKGCIPN